MLLMLIVFRIREEAPPTARIPVCRRLCHAAIPLAAGDVLRSGINTAENLMVPRQLAKNTGIGSPIAAFGTISGMVFPVLMFPACILFGLAELLIPELARCNAAGNTGRTAYLVQKSLRMALLYSALFCGLLFLMAEPLCGRIYGSTEAGAELKRYTVLVPMLYCDAITDAMTKGLGQQKACVRYNILTSAMDVLFLYILLPKYGMGGYFISFFLTHLLNFLLSIRRLKIITGEALVFSDVAYTAAAICASVRIASHAPSLSAQIFSYIPVFICILWLTKVLRSADLYWLFGLVCAKKHPA